MGTDNDIVIIVAKHLPDVELYLSETVIYIKKWLKERTYTRRDTTEAVLTMKWRNETTADIRMGNHTFTSKPTIKSLQRKIGVRLNLKQHMSALRYPILAQPC